MNRFFRWLGLCEHDWVTREEYQRKGNFGVVCQHIKIQVCNKCGKWRKFVI